jgi:hypothetical protein
MAALTQETQDCTNYMLELYMRKQTPFEIDDKLLACLLEFQKWTNLTYLFGWA